MIEQRQVVVGGEDFLLESLPATKALVLLAKVCKIIGGLGKGVKDVPSGAKSTEDLKSQISEALHVGQMVEGFLEKLDPKEAPDLIRNILRDSLACKRDKYPHPKQWDDWYENRFASRLGDIIQLLTHIFQLNYGDAASIVSEVFGSGKPAPVPGPGAPSTVS